MMFQLAPVPLTLRRFQPPARPRIEKCQKVKAGRSRRAKTDVIANGAARGRRDQWINRAVSQVWANSLFRNGTCKETTVRRSAMKGYSMVFSVLVMFAAAGSLAAHHGFMGIFDLTNPPTRFEGAITKVEWENPHISFNVDVKDETGKITN